MDDIDKYNLSYVMTGKLPKYVSASQHYWNILIIRNIFQGQLLSLLTLDKFNILLRYFNTIFQEIIEVVPNEFIAVLAVEQKFTLENMEMS